MGKSVKKSLTNTIQKSINLSQHKNIVANKVDRSTHQASKQLAVSIYKSKAIYNPTLNAQKSNLANSLYKSNHKSGTSSIMRRSKMH